MAKANRARTQQATQAKLPDAPEKPPEPKPEPKPVAVTHEEDPILTYSEAGRMLGKPRSTVWRWANDGLLEIYRHPSGIPGVRKSEVDKFLYVKKGG